jgi:hypothetical protein
MELLFVVLGGVLIGGGLRYLFPHRHSYGVLLLPAVGGAVTAAVWAGLTWLGWRFDGGWIWVVSLVVPAIVCILVATVLARYRVTADDRMLQSLSKA